MENLSVNPASSILKGYRVLELASVLAGPAVGQFFAECGAEVIKVESLPAGGDMTRQWKLPAEPDETDISAYFTSVNWGKHSLALDLRQAEARDIIHKLAAQSDIVLSSYTPATARKLGMRYEDLSLHKKDLIFGRITGFGPHEDRPAFDALVQAEAGFMYMNGQPEGASTKMPVALMDILAAHQLKEGILLALLQKMKTGEGAVVEVSLIDAALASLANQAANWLVAGHVPRKEGSRHPNIAPYGDTFLSADGREIILAVGTDRQFQALCRVLKLSDLPDDPLYTTNTARVANRTELVAALAPAFALREAEELVQALSKNKVPAGIVRTMPDVMARYAGDVLLRGRDAHGRELQGIPHFVASVSDGGKVSHFLPHLPPPPSFGGHSHVILYEKLGYSKELIQDLIDKKVINSL